MEAGRSSTRPNYFSYIYTRPHPLCEIDIPVRYIPMLYDLIDHFSFALFPTFLLKANRILKFTESFMVLFILHHKTQNVLTLQNRWYIIYQASLLNRHIQDEGPKIEFKEPSHHLLSQPSFCFWSTRTERAEYTEDTVPFKWHHNAYPCYSHEYTWVTSRHTLGKKRENPIAHILRTPSFEYSVFHKTYS